MIDDILSELKNDIAKSHEVLRKTLSKIRTGRANPDILDGVRVDYWGTPTPISQMATVSVPEARMLFVKAWDRQNVKAIEKAIIQSDLGLNPQTDGDLIRLPHTCAHRGAPQRPHQDTPARLARRPRSVSASTARTRARCSRA